MCSNRRHLFLILSIAVASFAPLRALGQEGGATDRIRAMEERIQEQDRKLEVLTEEVERLRLEGVAEPTYERFGGLSPSASKVYFAEKGLSIGSYGEMVYENLEDGVDRLDLLRLVLYFGYRFTDNIIFNSEIEFEHASTSKNNDGKTGEVSVEFAYLDFLLNDRFSLRAGMLLTPLGIINEAHEPVIFMSALRPEVERFIIPTTWRGNGIGVYGGLTEGLSYKLYLMEGLDVNGFNKASDGIRGGRSKGNQARFENPAVAGRLEYKGVRGLSLHTSIFAGNSGQGRRLPNGEEIGAFTLVYSLGGIYQYRGLELRGLYAGVNLDDVEEINQLHGLTGSGSIGERMNGWYLEADYDIMPHFRAATSQQLLPFVRYERYDTQAEVPGGFLEDPANEREIVTVGMAYKPIQNIIFKADYQSVDGEADGGDNRFHLAFGYNF